MLRTPMTAIQTIGYDTEKKQYTGTWIDSVMNHMWKYEGSVDATGKILTLDAKGPDFEVAAKMREYRDAYEFKSADHIVSTSSMLRDNGKWVVFQSPGFAVNQRTLGFAITSIRTPTGFNDCGAW